MTWQQGFMAEPRLLIDQPLAGGTDIALGEGQSRYVGTVLRLELGDGLRVFNATDGEWRARVSAKSKRGVSVRVEEFVRAARAPADLDLLFAPVKRHATDLIVEKATEMGVARIRPVITQRTVAETVRLDRLQSIAREAAEQTERFDAPTIFEPLTLVRALHGWDPNRPLIFADEQGEAPPALQALLSWTAGVPAGEVAGGPRKLALLIGPEGGFTSEERRMLRALTYVTPVSLGPRILRAETAVIAALSVIQSVWGDWR